MLGLVELEVGGRPIPLDARQPRSVLALLALHANAPVAADRLIEGVWGEDPPASAQKMVQLYVSRLRRLLEGSDAEILTRGRGYELRIDANAVDALRFERLVETATRAGDGSAAREALALWRGPPLDDASGELLAPGHVQRLEELRARARELAIDGELAAGDQLAALGEIERLIADSPLREHPHAQRMLALYRAGRQAEALEAYHAARRRLVDELGIEPGPELRELHEAILRQDPALDLPGRRRLPDVVRRRPVPWRALLGVAALLAVCAAGVATLAAGGADPVVVPVDSVALIDPASNAVTAAIPVAPGPGPIAAADGRVWLLDLDNATLTHLDARTRKVVETKGIGGGQSPAGNIVAGPGSVWIAEGCQDGSPGTIERLDTTLRPVRAAESVEISLAPIRDPGTTAPLQTSPGCGLATDGRELWSANYVPPGLARLNARAGIGRVVAVRRQPFVTTAMALGAGSLWVVDPRRDTVWRVDPRTLRRHLAVATGSGPAAVASTAGFVWVANAGDGSVSRIDPRSNTVSRAVSVGDSPVALAAGDGALWVANSGDGTVTRIDTRTARAVATIRVGHRPQGVAVAGGRVWVTVQR